MNKQLITIDGPSGSGKTTIGKLLAKDLNLTFFSSGAVYRVITKHYLENKTLNFDNLDILSTDPIEFQIDTKHYFEEDLYSPEINDKSSELAQQLEIRTIVENILKFIYDSSKFGLVIEGRDMGSVVFPNSKNKIYLDSSKKNRSYINNLSYRINQKVTLIGTITNQPNQYQIIDNEKQLKSLNYEGYFHEF